MLSKSLLFLVSCVVIVTVTSGRPSPHDNVREDRDRNDRRIKDRDDDYQNLFRDKRADWDDEKDMKIQLFLYIAKSLKTKENDSKSFNKLFKTFLKAIYQKKTNDHGKSSDLRKRSDDHDDSKEWDDLFDKDDFNYKYDNDIKEEKAKKVFLLYIKFKAHYLAQKVVEKSRRNKEEKVKRQFSLFSELIDFVEEIKAHKETVEKFSKLVDLKLKLKFASFKKCFFHNECQKDDDKDLDDFKGGEWKHYFSMDDNKKHEKDDKDLELFLALYNLVSDKGNNRHKKNRFRDWDSDDEDDDKKRYRGKNKYDKDGDDDNDSYDNDEKRYREKNKHDKDGYGNDDDGDDSYDSDRKRYKGKNKFEKDSYDDDDSYDSDRKRYKGKNKFEKDSYDDDDSYDSDRKRYKGKNKYDKDGHDNDDDDSYENDNRRYKGQKKNNKDAYKKQNEKGNRREKEDYGKKRDDTRTKKNKVDDFEAFLKNALRSKKSNDKKSYDYKGRDVSSNDSWEDDYRDRKERSRDDFDW